MEDTLNRKNRVCPVERAGSLDTWYRRWFQNPRKILGPYITVGMTVLDVGCGPGFFTIDMARMVGPTGRVIAADLQRGMLDKVRAKIKDSDLENRIELHLTSKDSLGVAGPVDFALAFYVVHELPDQAAFFSELASIVRPGGRVLIVEPPFHVNKAGVAEMIARAAKAGFVMEPGPRLFLNKSVVLVRG